MKYAKTLGLLLVAAVAVAGCNPQSGGTPKDTNKKSSPGKDGHSHGKGPNDGVVFDFGAYHAELTVDHDEKSCRVLFVTEDAKDAKPEPVAVKELTVITKATKTKAGTDVPAMTIKMLPKDEKNGKAATFVGTHDGLANVVDYEGTVIGEIDGKKAQGKFKE